MRIGSFGNTAMGATGAAGVTEVVARSAAWSSLPHAPGVRMTVVTLTPSKDTFPSTRTLKYFLCVGLPTRIT